MGRRGREGGGHVRLAAEPERHQWVRLLALVLLLVLVVVVAVWGGGQ
jgi:hypothetical protein